MGFRKIISFAACLLVIQVCRVQGQTISSEAFSATSVSNPSSCGSQFVIPAIIKPVMLPEPYTAPAVPDFYGGYNGCAVPPIIIEEGGSSSNDMWLPLILIFALKNMGGKSGGCASYGSYGMPGYGYYGGMGGCGGYGGYSNGGCGYNGCNGGCGYNGCNGGCGYNGCNGGCGYNGCNGCNYPYSNCYDSCDNCCNPPTEINLIIKTDNSSSNSP